MTATTTKKQERTEAIETLRGMLKPGDTVYTILRHVSRSGMSRSISLVIVSDDDPRPFEISYLAARAMGDKIDQERGGIKISGAGMDMGFALVYNLGRTLWPEGFDTEEGYWRNEPLDHDPDGGYALKQRWL
jgi:hypothetical protein